MGPLGPHFRADVRDAAGDAAARDTFLLPRTFGKNSAWYLNVQAAGWCIVTYKGRDYTLIDPEVVDYASAAPAFPRYELLQFRLVGINEYLRPRQAPAGWSHISGRTYKDATPSRYCICATGASHPCTATPAWSPP